MAISGFNLKDPNTRLRFFVIVFMGILAFGSVLYWRSHLIASSEYVYFDAFEPTLDTRPGKPPSSENVLRSENYQIETSEAFPATE